MDNKSDSARDSSGVETGKKPSSSLRIRRYILNITISGVMAAIVFLATQIKITTAIGYGNLGDGFILAASYVLGPLAFFPAAIGSALADLILGYAVYIPATFLIKGCMGLVAGAILRRKNVSWKRRILAVLLAEVIMVAGYLGFESLPFMYGPAAALTSVPMNLVQGAFGIGLGLVLMAALRSVKERFYEKLHG